MGWKPRPPLGREHCHIRLTLKTANIRLTLKTARSLPLALRTHLNTRSRRCSRFRQVFVFCDTVNNLLLSAVLSTNSLHCWQLLSATSTRTNVLVGVFSFSIQLHIPAQCKLSAKSHLPTTKAQKVSLTDSPTRHTTDTRPKIVRAKMMPHNAIPGKGNKSNSRSLPLRA